MRRRRYRIFQNVCGTLAFLGFMLMWGSVGAMECETISMAQGIIQSLIGLSMFAGAAYLGGIMQ